MAKNKPERSGGRSGDERRIRIQQIIFAILAIVLILSMLVSLISF